MSARGPSPGADEHNDKFDTARPKVRVQFHHTVSGRTGVKELVGNGIWQIGRDDVAECLGLEEVTISRKHIELWMIVYDTEDLDIPPMLYLRAVGLNATTVMPSIVADTPGTEACIKMTERCRPRLVSQNDVILLSPTVHLKLAIDLTQYCGGLLDGMRREEARLLPTDYIITERLVGRGGHGAVFVSNHPKTLAQLACKFVDFHSLSEKAAQEAFDRNAKRYEQRLESGMIDEYIFQRKVEHDWKLILTKKLGQCRDELLIHKSLSHPNIAALKQIIMTNHSVYIFQELVAGGDLFSYLETRGPSLSDAESAVVIRQLLEAVSYLHDNHIVHRDIKPENILMTSHEKGTRIALIDFGLAKRTTPGKEATAQNRMHSLVGTRGYAAPEVLLCYNRPDAAGYDASVDLWSVGAIAAILLTGQPISTTLGLPEADDEESLQQPSMVLKGLAKLNFMLLDDEQRTAPENSIWGRISSKPRDFISKLLVMDVDKRLTARQALQHKWLVHRSYKVEMENLYQQAIADWQPAEELEIEWLNMSEIGQGPFQDKSVLEELFTKASHYFQ